ncbi:MAG TPA: hypothetical protein VFU86_15990 [Terriglobales bacterium]|nr:hypothetical protein [Terriglobales bacterium]
MFEEELELEKKEGGGFGPVIVIVLMVGLIVGGIGYVIWQGTRTLKPDEATRVLTAALQQQKPASVRFQTGHLKYSNSVDSLTDPQYKLLEKLGIITTKTQKDGSMDVALTAEGEKRISAFPELKKKGDQDGTTLYVVPLAKRNLVKVEKINKLGPSAAQVEYTWTWQPNELGKDFDASGPAVQAFSTYERSVLIQKYGADFYNARPQDVTVKLVKLYNGWQFAPSE